MVLQNGKKVRFSSKETGKILKTLREYLGNEKVVQAPKFADAFRNLYYRITKKRKPKLSF
ncbi:DUF956 family protein [Lactococcus fujiensis]|uniref:DUF956 family protein n=1 Tax=Lactococcus fujiensis TaxID=610251 RepID=UPI003571141B